LSWLVAMSFSRCAEISEPTLRGRRDEPALDGSASVETATCAAAPR
jgi:hypothetical protein